MWESCGFSALHSYFVALPQVKNQHLSALNKRRRLVWCTSMLQRRGEAKRLDSGTPHVQGSHFLSVPFRSANDLQATLCRSVSRISIAVSVFFWESPRANDRRRGPLQRLQPRNVQACSAEGGGGSRKYSAQGDRRRRGPRRTTPPGERRKAMRRWPRPSPGSAFRSRWWSTSSMRSCRGFSVKLWILSTSPSFRSWKKSSRWRPNRSRARHGALRLRGVSATRASGQGGSRDHTTGFLRTSRESNCG